jgi:hypothetical protein
MDLIKKEKQVLEKERDMLTGDKGKPKPKNMSQKTSVKYEEYEAAI